MQKVCSSNEPNRPHISSITSDFKERETKTRPARQFFLAPPASSCLSVSPRWRLRRFGEGVFTSGLLSPQDLFLRNAHFFRFSLIIVIFQCVNLGSQGRIWRPWRNKIPICYAIKQDIAPWARTPTTFRRIPKDSLKVWLYVAVVRKVGPKIDILYQHYK